MVNFVHLSVLSLAVVVVSGVPRWLVAPGESPDARQDRRTDCNHWCENPDVKGSYMCCEDITEAITPPITTTEDSWGPPDYCRGRFATTLCPDGTCQYWIELCEDTTEEPTTTENTETTTTPIITSPLTDNLCNHKDLFQCPGSVGCIWSSWLCDGYDDCGDGADEENCTAPITTTETPRPETTTCL